MMTTEAQAADLRLPTSDEAEVIAVTGSSAVTQLTGSSGKIPDKRAGRIHRWVARDGDIYAVFGFTNSLTADETATSGATVPIVFLKDQPVDLALPDLASVREGRATACYVALKGSVASCKLRFWPTSG